MHYCLMSVPVEVGYMSKARRYSEEKCPWALETIGQLRYNLCHAQ